MGPEGAAIETCANDGSRPDTNREDRYVHVGAASDQRIGGGERAMLQRAI